ncbi:hypothetical protein [Paenibacillus contaminans]|uniref:Uncharacterized protein n=1 Tax=Paenibacillus contaminans TaxID=450362 RepID=A0A329MI46_9BACL|nr:hypothetical protein [Paenibacillus contaminans]RAV19499.1 hypothetical protein DQG23_21160 [Paenibacillus contaminans]
MFTPEQQTEIDRIVKERLAAGRKKHYQEMAEIKARAAELPSYKKLYEEASAEIKRLTGEVTNG